MADPSAIGSSAAQQSPNAEPTILIHTALTALTPLIPLPFVDDIARVQVEQRLVQALADARGLELEAKDVKRLSATPGTGNPLRGTARRAVRAVVLWPVRTLIKKYVAVLVGKKIVNVATDTYCRGFLVDYVFAQGWCAPAGPRTAAEVRDAIDAVLKSSPLATAAVTAAIRSGLTRSKDAASGAFEQVRRRLILWQKGSGRAPIAAAEKAELAEVTEELQRSLDGVSSEHLEVLRARLAQRLDPSAEDSVAAGAVSLQGDE